MIVNHYLVRLNQFIRNVHPNQRTHFGILEELVRSHDSVKLSFLGIIIQVLQ